MAIELGRSGVVRGSAGTFAILLGLATLCQFLISLAAPSARAFTVIDATYTLSVQAERTYTVYREDCPGSAEGAPCVSTTSPETPMPTTVTDERSGSALGEVEDEAYILTSFVTGLGTGYASSGLTSSVGPSGIMYSSSLGSVDGADGDSVAWSFFDEMGLPRYGYQRWLEEFRMTNASAQLDLVLEVEKLTEIELNLGRETTSVVPADHVAFARISPLSETGELLPALFEEQVTEVGTEDVFRLTLLPGRFALRFSNAGDGREAFHAGLVVVPEPGTSALFGLGLMALAYRRRNAEPEGPEKRSL